LFFSVPQWFSASVIQSLAPIVFEDVPFLGSSSLFSASLFFSVPQWFSASVFLITSVVPYFNFMLLKRQHFFFSVSVFFSVPQCFSGSFSLSEAGKWQGIRLITLFYVDFIPQFRRLLEG
jgi:hypothetical protein